MDIDDPAIGRTIHAAGHETNYFDVGDGEPLLLLHGSGPGVSAYWNWVDVLEPLSRTFRVIAPDIAGFGYTGVRSDVEYGLGVWVDHLIGFLDALGLASVTLVGNSFGGALTLAAASRFPERVDRIVVMGTPAGEFAQTEALAAGWHYEPDRDAMAEFLQRLPHDPVCVTDAMIDARHRASARPGAQDAYRRLMPEPQGPGTLVRAFPERIVRTLSQPALVLHGREDIAVPFVLGQRLFDWLPNAEAHFFAGTGHWVQAERPAAFVNTVTDFVRRTTARPDDAA